MPRAISCACASVCLAALAKVKRLAAKGALVDLALSRAREGQTVILQLYHRLWRLAAHVLDGVLHKQTCLDKRSANVS